MPTHRANSPTFALLLVTRTCTPSDQLRDRASLLKEAR